MPSPLLAAGLIAAFVQTQSAETVRYPIVDTNQNLYYGTGGGTISTPSADDPLADQDAGHRGNAPSYKANDDGTVSDLVTGLMWQKEPDGGAKQTFADAVAGAAKCRTGGHADWRLPSIKELYSLIDFSGGMGHTPAKPYIDTAFFGFSYGDETRGERAIDSQWWTSTQYISTTMGENPTVFGVNFADGRIKGYPRDRGPRGAAKMWVRYVRGNPQYGKNDFVDQKDGTVIDRATGLMWAKADAGAPMDWPHALESAASATTAGHSDWRLPNAKELQSIVDYSRSPAAKNEKQKSCAIDPVFDVTNPESYYWTSTTHLDDRGPGGPGRAAVYVCFGRGLGYFSPPSRGGGPPRQDGPRGNDGPPKQGGPPRQGEHGRGSNTNAPSTPIDVHGAGAQRSDPKIGDPSQFPKGRGPQGDDVRINNYVRLVRDVNG